MIIKSASNKDRDIAVLEKIAGNPGLSDVLAKRIANEIKFIRAGSKGEREAAYEIDFHLRNSRDYAVIHDLRIEYEGRVAQIDHLVIDRNLRFWVLESKHFAEGVAVNSEGEFTAFYWGRPKGIPSPIEQNKKHCHVLCDVLTKSGNIKLPKFLFLTARPKFRNVVLVSKQARIQRAREWKEQNAWILKADLFWSFLKKREKEKNEGEPWVFGAEQLEQVATELAMCHQPIQFDWEARFASSDSVERPELVQIVGPPKEDVSSCERCGVGLDAKVVWFCRRSKARFLGGVYCRTCQPKFRQPYSKSPLSLGSPSFSEVTKAEEISPKSEGGLCDRCGELMPARVVLFCRENAEKFRGHLFCRQCQAKV